MPLSCECELLFLPRPGQRSGLMASCSPCLRRPLSIRRHSRPEFRKPAQSMRQALDQSGWRGLSACAGRSQSISTALICVTLPKSSCTSTGDAGSALDAQYVAALASVS